MATAILSHCGSEAEAVIPVLSVAFRVSARSFHQQGRAYRRMVSLNRYEADLHTRHQHRQPKKERPFCGALTKAGKRCQARAMPGHLYCQLHEAQRESGRRSNGRGRDGCKPSGCKKRF